MRRSGKTLLRKALKKHLINSQARNRSLSLRSIAKKMGLSPTTLSLFLSGKRDLSQPMALKVLNGLSMNSRDYAELKDHLLQERSKHEILPSLDRIEWLHFLILCYLQTEFGSWPAEDFVKVTAKKLKVTASRIRTAIADLIDLKMVAATDKGWEARMLDGNFEQPGNLKIRAMNREIINAALERMDRLEDPEVFKTTDFTSINIPGSPKKFALIKAKIEKFQYDIAKILESGEPGSEVYTLAVQFFKV